MPKPKKQKKDIKGVAKEYQVQLETGGQTYKTEGGTLLEALNAIPLTWLTIKYKGMLKVQKGAQTFERFYFPKQLKFLFGLNKVMKEKTARDIERVL